MLDTGAHSPQKDAASRRDALQRALQGGAALPLIATDENGIIALFNPGAERMLGYAAAEVVDHVSPTHLCDPLEVMARAVVLSREFATPIAPGFAATGAS